MIELYNFLIQTIKSSKNSNGKSPLQQKVNKRFSSTIQAVKHDPLSVNKVPVQSVTNKIKRGNEIIEELLNQKYMKVKLYDNQGSPKIKSTEPLVESDLSPEFLMTINVTQEFLLTIS